MSTVLQLIIVFGKVEAAPGAASDRYRPLYMTNLVVLQYVKRTEKDALQ
jgi:hypothetical protein